MQKNYLFTSESVSEGHPDKVADQVSDSVLDALIAEDPASRVACETMINTGMVVLSGEITSNASVDYTELTRNTIREIGYRLINNQLILLRVSMKVKVWIWIRGLATRG